MKIWKQVLIIVFYFNYYYKDFYVESISLLIKTPKWNLLSCSQENVPTICFRKTERKGFPKGNLGKAEKKGRKKNRKAATLKIANISPSKKYHKKKKKRNILATNIINTDVRTVRLSKPFYFIYKMKRHDVPKKRSKDPFHKTYLKKKKIRSVKIRMILAPKGSIHEKKTEEILSDPIKNYPWEISIPFHETITCEQNPYYNFLKSEWAYLDHRKDRRKPCGKIEGGLENYDGKGLKLEGGIDRQRYKKIPYHLDHGVEWRKYDATEMIRFDMDPDGNQDQTFLETEEDLEYRQWGNWNYNSAKETTQLNSAWRDPVLSKDLSNLIYPWSHKAHENHPVPFGYRGPSGFIPEIKLEWELAARGFFGGYFDDPNWDRIKCYRMTKKLILEWHELEQKKRQLEKKHSNDKKKKKRKKSEKGNANKGDNNDASSSSSSSSSRSDDLKELDRINSQIAKIRTELFGISSRKKYSSKQIKLINEHALLRAKEILLDYILEPNNDPDYHAYYLDRHEPIDYIGGGNHNCSEKEIKNKTVVLNMCIYPIKPQHESYSLNMSIEEMAEMYHYFMTEIRGEGRVHNLFEEPVEPKYLCYELKNERKNFPTLMSLYKPLWTNKIYGEEFGDALQQHEKVRKKKKEFSSFAQKLKTKPKQKLSKKELEQYNFVNDYEHFDEQYDF